MDYKTVGPYGYVFLTEKALKLAEGHTEDMTPSDISAAQKEIVATHSSMVAANYRTHRRTAPACTL